LRDGRQRIRRSSGRLRGTYSRLLGSITVAGATFAVLFATPAAEPAGKPKPLRGGTVVVALHIDPPSLNLYLDLGAPRSTSVITDQVLASAYHDVGRAGELVPDLIVGDPKITPMPFSLTYTIKKEARWSDGVPITARDFVFTWQLLARSAFKVPDSTREEYGAIVKAKILGPKKVRFLFRRPMVEWKDLFAPVLPWHALAGEDFDNVWRDRIDNPKTGRPIASGPFIFESRSRGNSLTLSRNANYWGRKAYLDRLSFRFLLDYGDELQALLDGDIDLLQETADLAFSDLPNSPGIRVRSGGTTVWEHIDFQLGSKGHPALRQPYVRQALAYGIDRKTLTAQLYRVLAPDLNTAQSVVFLPFERQYRPHWQIWGYNPQKAMRLLRSHGCRKGGDGIFSCDGRRLSFRLVSTGSGLRARTFELIQLQLRRIGIELVKDFRLGITISFGDVLPGGDWDLALFAWLRTTEPGADSQDIWACKGEFNYMGYCNRSVTKLLLKAATEPSANRRAQLRNRADALIARDLPTLPLFDKPGYLIYNGRIRNVTWNPIDVLWNAQNWWIAPR
jgi:peptide/nickel transport system substrate-binding protein